MSFGHDNPPPGFAACTRPPGHDGPCAHPFAHGDMFAAVQMLAADNARLCGIVLAADALADTIENLLLWSAANEIGTRPLLSRIADAIDAYKISRLPQ